ncbi:MAG: helix-turn-helix transcriptional regulator [Solirubrobacteraceae bacterium]
MRISQQLTDDAVLGELGERLARLRLQRNLTQLQLAEEAGVDRKAVVRIEAGEPVQLLTFVRVLRALGLVDALDALVPPPQASPIELLELRGRARRRARPGSKRPSQPTDDTREPWRWGDER